MCTRYYRLFASIYGVVGSFSDLVFVNSTWTADHIRHIWSVEPAIVYPPCNTRDLQSFAFSHRQNVIVSVAQFRPEKDHQLQVRMLKRLFQLYPKHKGDIKLIMAGGCRHEEDYERVRKLKDLIAELSLEDSVEIRINVAHSELQELLETSLIGLHTMWNEHFGISVVEYMAAGLITLAHNSGGPRMDILVGTENQPTGFLAENEEEYAKTVHSILEMTPAARLAIQTRARASVLDRFSDATFTVRFTSLFDAAFRCLSFN